MEMETASEVRSEEMDVVSQEESGANEAKEEGRSESARKGGSEQSFKPGADAESALRNSMVSKIAEILNSRRKNLTEHRVEEHLQAAKRIEEHLFATSSTQENYIDEGSLPVRVTSIMEILKEDPHLLKLQENEPAPPLPTSPFTQRIRDAQQKMRNAPLPARPTKRRFEPVDFEEHSVERNRVLEAIVDILQTRRPNGTTDWHSACPHLHRRLEEFLFRQSPSLEVYGDLPSLPERLKDYITLGGQKKPFQTKKLKSVPIPEHLLQSYRESPPPPLTRRSTPIKKAPAAPVSSKKAEKAEKGDSGQSSSSTTRSQASSVKAPGTTTTASAAAGGGGKKQRSPSELLRQQQRRLLLLQHAAKCAAPAGECPVTPLCADMRSLWDHIMACPVSKCSTPHCISSRYVLTHFCNCQDQTCQMCKPVREGWSLDALEKEGSVGAQSAEDSPRGAPGLKRKSLGTASAAAGDENAENRAYKRRTDSGPATAMSGGRSVASGSSAGTGGTGHHSQHHSSAYAARQMSKHITSLFRPIVEQLLEVPLAYGYFGAPVDPVLNGAPNYFEIVKHPMDLGTVTRKLDTFAYTTTQALLDDVELVFGNAQQYNVSGTTVYNLAQRLRSRFQWASRKPRMELSQRLEELRGGGKAGGGSGSVGGGAGAGAGGGGSSVGMAGPSSRGAPGHRGASAASTSSSQQEQECV